MLDVEPWHEKLFMITACTMPIKSTFNHYILQKKKKKSIGKEKWNAAFYLHVEHTLCKF